MVAADRGDPPLWADVDVELDVVDRNNKPPLWDLAIYGPIFVKENVTVGTVVTSVKARSVATNEHSGTGEHVTSFPPIKSRSRPNFSHFCIAISHSLVTLKCRDYLANTST